MGLEENEKEEAGNHRRWVMSKACSSTRPGAVLDVSVEKRAVLMSVFVGLANDGWTTVYFDHARTPAVGNLIAGVFFISLVVVGQMILFNLFLAILLKEFDEGKLMEEAKTEQMGPKKVGCLERCVIKCKGKKVPIKDPGEKYTDVT